MSFATTIRVSCTSSIMASRNAYQLAAEVANDGPCDVVSLQHEFGLFPGPWGVDVLDFLRNCRKPVVTTFHTMMTQPERLPAAIDSNGGGAQPSRRRDDQGGGKALDEVYGVSGSKVHIIPHGVPDIPVDCEGNCKNPAWTLPDSKSSAVSD